MKEAAKAIYIEDERAKTLLEKLVTARNKKGDTVLHTVIDKLVIENNIQNQNNLQIEDIEKILKEDLHGHIMLHEDAEGRNLPQRFLHQIKNKNAKDNKKFTKLFIDVMKKQSQKDHIYYTRTAGSTDEDENNIMHNIIMQSKEDDEKSKSLLELGHAIVEGLSREHDGIKYIMALKNDEGNTPLHCIIDNGSNKAIELGVKIVEGLSRKHDGLRHALKQQDAKGNTPLHCIINNGSNKAINFGVKIVENLARKDGLRHALEQQDNKGNTPLHTIINNGSNKTINFGVEIVKYFVSKPSEPSYLSNIVVQQDANGKSILHLLANKTPEEFKKFKPLSKNIVNVIDNKSGSFMEAFNTKSGKDSDGPTPIELAFKNKNIEFLKHANNAKGLNNSQYAKFQILAFNHNAKSIIKFLSHTVSLVFSHNAYTALGRGESSESNTLTISVESNFRDVGSSISLIKK